MLVAREAVDPGLGAVAQHEPVTQQVVLDGSDRAQHAGVVAGDESDRAERQQRRVDLGRVVVLHEGVALGVVALAQHLVAHLLAQLAPALDRAGQPVLLDAADGAVEGGPHHGARVREVPQRPADLPEPVVRLVPVLREVVDERALQVPRVGRLREPA